MPEKGQFDYFCTTLKSWQTPLHLKVESVSKSKYYTILRTLLDITNREKANLLYSVYSLEEGVEEHAHCSKSQ